ncbi:MAG: 3-demethylubiquinone-9 3-methyltransferase, partial [uncultured Frankineae bacterium]
AAHRPQPVVRHRGRAGRAVLRLGVPELAHRQHGAVPRGLARPGRDRHDRRVRAGRPALRGHQRRTAVPLHGGGVVLDHLPDAGGGRPLLAGADRGRPGVAVRVAQGPLRPVLAGRPGRHGRDLRRPRPRAGAARRPGDARDEEARPGSAAGGSRRRPRRL